MPKIQVGSVYYDNLNDSIHIHCWENGIFEGQSFSGRKRLYDQPGRCISEDNPRFDLVVDDKEEASVTDFLSFVLCVSFFLLGVATLLWFSFEITR